MPAFLAVIPALIGAGVSAYQAIKARKDQKKAQELAEKELANAPQYKTPQSVLDQLNEARASKNAVNPALMMAYQQAQQAAAGNVANANRNATSGAESLAAGSQAQGQLQSIIPGLANAQTGYAMQNRGLYNQALAGMTEDDRIKFQNAQQRNSDLVNYRLGLAGAATQNQGAAMNGVGTALGSRGVNNWLAGYGKPVYDPNQYYGVPNLHGYSGMG